MTKAIRPFTVTIREHQFTVGPAFLEAVRQDFQQLCRSLEEETQRMRKKKARPRHQQEGARGARG